MKMRFLIALISLISYTTIKAQDYKGEVWGAYINTISLSDTWKIWNDYHYVTNGFSIIRPRLPIRRPKDISLPAGYAFVLASTSNTNQLIRQENRIWGQAIKKIHLHPKLQYIIRFRYDADSANPWIVR
ncbi:MAG: DUF2490 domain-containing protein [Saprospiraceae bacterium]|nr:DUF2490 domain-containing protein [Saprospiraceae bacterium]